MDIEQKVKEIEEMANDYSGYEYCDGKRFASTEALKVINHLQSEVERYKSLWKTCEVDFVSLQGKSNEIIAELKAEKVEIFRSLEKELRLHELTTNERSCRNEEFIHSVINRSINLQLSLIREKFNKFKGKHLPKPPKQNH